MSCVSAIDRHVRCSYTGGTPQRATSAALSAPTVGSIAGDAPANGGGADTPAVAHRGGAGGVLSGGVGNGGADGPAPGHCVWVSSQKFDSVVARVIAALLPASRADALKVAMVPHSGSSDPSPALFERSAGFAFFGS